MSSSPGAPDRVMLRSTRAARRIPATLLALALAALGCVTEGKKRDACQSAYDGCISMALDDAALEHCLAERGAREAARRE